MNELKTVCFQHPIGSMYGIFTHIYHENQPNVAKYTIHGSYGTCSKTCLRGWVLLPCFFVMASGKTLPGILEPYFFLIKKGSCQNLSTKNTTQVIQFVTFSSPIWRSLKHLKGSLNNPKKVTLNHLDYKKNQPIKNHSLHHGS